VPERIIKNIVTLKITGMTQGVARFRDLACSGAWQAARGIRTLIEPPQYRLNKECVIWPLGEFYAGDHPIASKLVALTGPIKTDAQSEAMERYLGKGYRIVGVSSYQEFPGRLPNPHEDAAVYDFRFFDVYGDACVGWLHCFRRPDNYLPEGVPRLFLTESDLTDYRRIRPGRADHVALPRDAAYDFIYVCGPGPWNAFCRNLPLARRCIGLLADNGFRVLVVGRDDSKQWAEAPGVDVQPYLRWYDFLGHLSRARFLFVPNIHDASPRILAEAMCLNVPLLVNQGIVGGWHYVNQRTGVFFNDEHDFLQGVEQLLQGRFTPREHFVHHHGPVRSGRKLRRFLLKVARRNSVPSLPAKREEKADVDAATLDVGRKLTVSRCADPPRVAFLVCTHGPDHKTRCRAHYDTWGRRAEKVIYFSNEADDVLPVVCLDFEDPEQYSVPARKTEAILRYAWLRLASRYDWFLVGGDDLYVILHNLYAHLSSDEVVNRDRGGEPLYLGRRLKQPEADFTYNSGAAGYVLNKSALETFVESRADVAGRFGSAEDAMVGWVLEQSAVRPLDTRDEAGAERFHPFTPRHHCEYRRANVPENDWFSKYTREFELLEGIDGISERSISFHCANASLMYTLDELLCR